MKKPIAIVLALAAVLTLFACKPKDVAEEPQEDTSTLPPVIEVTPTPPPTPTLEPTPPPYDGAYNPLSGLPIADELVNARPLAIMLNNRKIAQPQLGMSQADIIFEVPAEGGITRMLAIFQDAAEAGNIGSVRSARPYYIELAEGFDAIYVCAGGSPGAYTTLKNNKVDYLDGVNGSRQEVFFRDSWRQKNMGYEHSLLTSGERLAKQLPNYSFRLEHTDAFKSPYVFEEGYMLALSATDSENAVNKLKIDFSSSKSTTFEYNTDAEEYRMTQHGSEYKDGNTGERVTFQNVIVIETSIAVIKGDSEGRLSVKTTGEGNGMVYIGGKAAAITWSKASHSAPLVFTLEDGTPLTLRSGHTYIGVTSSLSSIKYD